MIPFHNRKFINSDGLSAYCLLNETIYAVTGWLELGVIIVNSDDTITRLVLAVVSTTDEDSSGMISLTVPNN